MSLHWLHNLVTWGNIQGQSRESMIYTPVREGRIADWQALTLLEAAAVALSEGVAFEAVYQAIRDSKTYDV